MGFPGILLNLSLCLVVYFGFLFFPIVFSNYELLLYYLIFYFIISPSKPVCFLMRDRIALDLDGRGDRTELREEEERGNGNQCILCEENVYFQ